jgi:deazaflavin-dependent oxidoreductase (nitroreductase family)
MKLHGIAKTCPNSRRLIARRARARLDALLRPLFAHGPLSGKGVLTTTGRRTGKPRRHSVRAIRQRDRVYLVSISGTHSSWFANLQANPQVRLRLPPRNDRAGAEHGRRADLEGIARELRDTEDRTRAKAAYVGTVKTSDYVECFLHWRGLPSREKIQRLHEMWFEGGVPLVIELGELASPVGFDESSPAEVEAS